MGLIIRCLLAVTAGFVSHVLFYAPSLLFGKKWGQLLRYAIGYVSIIPLRQLFLDETEKCVNERVFMADILAGFMYGSGVFLGYLADKQDE